MSEIVQYIIKVKVDANQVPIIAPSKANPPQRVSNWVAFIIGFLELLAAQFGSYFLEDINTAETPSSYIPDDDTVD